MVTYLLPTLYKVEVGKTGGGRGNATYDGGFSGENMHCVDAGIGCEKVMILWGANLELGT